MIVIFMIAGACFRLHNSMAWARLMSRWFRAHTPPGGLPSKVLMPLAFGTLLAA